MPPGAVRRRGEEGAAPLGLLRRSRFPGARGCFCPSGLNLPKLLLPLERWQPPGSTQHAGSGADVELEGCVCLLARRGGIQCSGGCLRLSLCLSRLSGGVPLGWIGVNGERGGAGGVMQRVCNAGWAPAGCVMGVAGIYAVWGVQRGVCAQGVCLGGVGWAVQGCWEWSRVLGFLQGARGGGVEGVCERFTPHLGAWRGVSGARAVCWG